MPADVEAAQLLVELLIEAIGRADLLQERDEPAGRGAAGVRSWRAWHTTAAAAGGGGGGGRRALVRVVLAHLGHRQAARRQHRQLSLDRERHEHLVREPHAVRLHRVVAAEVKVAELRLLQRTSGMSSGGAPSRSKAEREKKKLT
eukprot:COSAG04_NODE_3464_length_2794_cov_5.669759_4_plen_145_part_00